MLNEVYEYEQYVTKPDVRYEKAYGRRLQQSMLESGLTGISRPLRIIARGRLFHDNPKGSKKDLVKDVENYLNNWFCMEDGWLVPYTNSFLKKNIRKQIENKRKEYNKPSFSMDPDPQNDFNQIHFDRIIAEAMTLGELSQYYLVADCAAEAEAEEYADGNADIYERFVFKDITKKAASDKYIPLLNDDKHSKDKNRSKYRNDVLMLISAYLLSYSKYYQNEALFSPSDFSNWRAKKNETARRIGYYISKQQLFSINPVFGNKKGPQRLVIHDTQWLEKCSWKLRKKEELFDILQKNRKTLFYRDYYYGVAIADHQDFVFGKDKNVGLIKRSFEEKDNGIIFKKNSFYLNELDFWKEKGLLIE